MNWKTMDNIYYIYHIPTFIHKNGKIGKIGCSEEPKNRVETQGYTDYAILETHNCIYEASKRERELQKEYGYPVDRVPYYISRNHWGSVAGKKGGKLGGKTQGKKNVESGHLAKIRKNININQVRQLGKTQGKKNVESGHWGKLHNNQKKPVLQYTKSGQFLKEWESIKDAGVNLEINKSHISKCCKGKLKSSGGFIWKYKGDE